MSALLGSDQEVARVDLPYPRDITVMLGDTSSSFLIGVTLLPNVTIQYGTGGTSNVTTLPARSLGSIYHVVAQSIVVRAAIPQNPSAVTSQRARFQAMVGLGRPSSQAYSVRYHVTSSVDIRLLPWVNRVSINPEYTGGVPPATLPEVKWYAVEDGGIVGETLTGTTPIAELEGPYYLPTPTTNMMRLTTLTAFDANVTQYWEL
jgi:hypothetical protein